MVPEKTYYIELDYKGLYERLTDLIYRLDSAAKGAEISGNSSVANAFKYVTEELRDVIYCEDDKD